MHTVVDIGPRLGIAPTCEALGVARATYYRSRRLTAEPVVRTSPRALSPGERQAVRDVLHEPRFLGPGVAGDLRDVARRGADSVLAADNVPHPEPEPGGERRNQLRHPHDAAPDLLATRPNEVWS